MTARAARVVIINDTSVAKGGATKLSLDLTEGLRKRGCTITYFAGDDGVNESFADWGVDVRAVHGKTLLQSQKSGLVNGIYNRRSEQALKALIQEIDAPDVVYHVHSWAQIHSPAIFSALKPIADRVAITAHDFFLSCPNGNFMIYPKSRQCELTPLSPSCIVANCDKRNYAHKVWRVGRQVTLNTIADFRHTPFTVLAIQRGMIPYLVKGGIPESSIEVLTNPAPRLCDGRVAAESNREILYIGRLDHEKGVDLLAAAARNAGAALRIFGEGQAEAAIRRANPEAIFEGWTPSAKLGPALQKARFLVMPSRCTEPFGLSGAEAMCVGVPVITSQSCLIGEDVKRYGMGDIVDVFDKDAFSSLIRKYMETDSLIKNMSIAAYENASKIGVEPDAWINAHLELYNEMRKRSIV